MSALFQIAKRKLLYELADDRQKRFGSFPAFSLLWNVLWYRFKMFFYGRINPKPIQLGILTLAKESAKINVMSIF
jgi:hypothetical protein